jgi:DNA-binding XRE family transcriptional regulator
MNDETHDAEDEDVRRTQTSEVDVDELDDDLAPHSVVDMKTFGRRLRALRVLRGFDRASDFTAVLRSRYGVEASDRTLYAIERGEQMPGIDFALACVAILHPPRRYFFPAFREDVVEALESPEREL